VLIAGFAAAAVITAGVAAGVAVAAARGGEAEDLLARPIRKAAAKSAKPTIARTIACRRISTAA
jgi:hypothetical protein